MPNECWNWFFSDFKRSTKMSELRVFACGFQTLWTMRCGGDRGRETVCVWQRVLTHVFVLYTIKHVSMYGWYYVAQNAVTPRRETKCSLSAKWVLINPFDHFTDRSFWYTYRWPKCISNQTDSIVCAHLLRNLITNSPCVAVKMWYRF